MSGFPFTDPMLSKLPAPTILDNSTFDEIYIKIIDYVKSKYPQYTQALKLESDPIPVILQALAYREYLKTQYYNKLFKSGLLAYADDETLDHMAALVPLKRLENESSDDFRNRIQLAPEGFSTAGPRGAYIFHAKSVSKQIADVFVDAFDLHAPVEDTPEIIAKRAEVLAKMQEYANLTNQPLPGHVHVYILPETDNVAPELLGATQTALSDDEIRPITDFVTVKPFTARTYNITAVLETDPKLDAQTILEAAQQSVFRYTESSRRFGKTHARTKLIASLHVDGVLSLELSSPATDIDVTPNEVAVLGEISLTEAQNA